MRRTAVRVSARQLLQAECKIKRGRHALHQGPLIGCKGHVDDAFALIGIDQLINSPGSAQAGS
jgi:hypothetical protein